jgi:hypothetical protein
VCWYDARHDMLEHLSTHLGTRTIILRAIAANICVLFSGNYARRDCCL